MKNCRKSKFSETIIWLTLNFIKMIRHRKSRDASILRLAQPLNSQFRIEHLVMRLLVSTSLHFPPDVLLARFKLDQKSRMETLSHVFWIGTNMAISGLTWLNDFKFGLGYLGMLSNHSTLKYCTLAVILANDHNFFV